MDETGPGGHHPPTPDRPNRPRTLTNASRIQEAGGRQDTSLMRVAEKGVALEETGLARYRPRPVRLSGPGTLTDTPYIQEAAGGVRDTLSMGSPNAGVPPPLSA